MDKEIYPPYECEGDIICGNGCEIVGYVRQTDYEIEWLADKCPYCGMKVEKEKVERTQYGR